MVTWEQLGHRQSSERREADYQPWADGTGADRAAVDRWADNGRGENHGRLQHANPSLEVLWEHSSGELAVGHIFRSVWLGSVFDTNRNLRVLHRGVR